MDESAILPLLTADNEGNSALTTDSIASSTGFDSARVVEVCEKIRAIQRSDSEQPSWRLASEKAE